jgi:hypothetical protein
MVTLITTTLSNVPLTVLYEEDRDLLQRHARPYGTTTRTIARAMNVPLRALWAYATRS